jgi:hypothetical protein
MWKKSIWQTQKIWRRLPANAAKLWRKSKKKEKSCSVQQSSIAKSGLQKKRIAKKGKKSQKTNYGNHPL